MSSAPTVAVVGLAAQRRGAAGEDRTRTSAESLLLERARAGDVGASERLFAAHSERAYRLAFRVTGNREDAEDVVQDAFVRCFRALPKHRGEASFSTWVMRIVINESVRVLQKRRRRERRWFSFARSESGSRTDAFAEAVDARMTSDAIAECLERLAPRDRTLLVMRYMEGYSAAEIGKLLEQPSGTIRSHLFRARQRLRDLLEPHLSIEDVPGATP